LTKSADCLPSSHRDINITLQPEDQ
jgi:hypothetical protein